MKNNKKLLPILIVIGVVLISIGATLAFINYSKNGQTENTIRLGNLTFHYEEGNRSISILDALPVDSDDDAKSSNNYFDFRITASTTFAEIPYVVTGRLSEDSDLDPSVVKVYLTRVSGNSETQLLYTTLDQLENKTFLNNGFVDKVLYRDTVPVNGSSYEVNYRLRLWIAEDTNFATGLYNNKRLSLTVNVYTNEGQSLTNEHITSPDDTSLKMISANGMYLLTPSSDTGVDYEATVPAEVNTVSFDVTEKNILATSTVTEIGQTLTMGNVRRISSQSGTFNLLTGDNYYRIRTTSADTTQTKDYIIKIEKELSRDNNLSYLAVTGYSFDETFDETGNDTTYHITMEGNTIVLEGNNNGGATIEGLGEKELVWGENTFTITVTPENPDEEPKTYTIVVNNVRPEEPSITGGTGDLWVSTDSTITIGESGSAISGIAGYEYLITTDSSLTVNDNTQATGTLITSPYSLPITNEGTSYIYYRTVSEDGNKSEWSNRITVHKDSVAPTNVTITASDSKASGSWHAKNTTLSVSATKSGASNLTYYFGTDSNPSTTGSGTTLSAVDETGTTYYAKACNQAGICSATVNHTAKVAETLRNLILEDNASTKDTIIPASELTYKLWSQSSSQYQTGLFKAPDTDGGYTYYFRGFNTANPQILVIGQNSWNILRINGNDTVRLMSIGYARMVSGETLTNYVNVQNIRGWCSNNTTTLASTYYSNTTETGGAKNTLDTWYDTNIRNNDNYKNIVTSGTYCQAAKVRINSNHTTGVSDKPLATAYTPSFDCPSNDGNVTNAKLTLDVGLISLDEYLMSGAIAANGSTAQSMAFAAANFSTTWDDAMMTPAGYSTENGGGYKILRIHEQGLIENRAGGTYSAYLHPVINVTGDVLVVKKVAAQILQQGGKAMTFSDMPVYYIVQ